MIVIDASAVIELVLRTERGTKVEVRILRPYEQLHAPHLLDIEIAQALRRPAQSKEITTVRAREALADHGALGIERTAHRDLLPRIWDLRGSLSAHDAAYVALAEVLQAPLVTSTAKLRALLMQ